MKKRPNECQVCGRPLTDPKSLALGYGPDCATKRNQFLDACGTTESEINELKANANRWISYFLMEMRGRRIGAAMRCLDAARRNAYTTGGQNA